MHSTRSTLAFLILWGLSSKSPALALGENNPVSGEGSEISVSTTAGNVIGFPKETRWGKVVTYFGIPYAQVPTESNRFLPSIPLLGQDSSVSSANNPKTHRNKRLPPACIQPTQDLGISHQSIFQGEVQISEDCLKINVYQPWNILPEELLPIVVFVAGNGYSFSSPTYDGSAMAAVGKVIVVTLNYRVGAFGFASMGNSTLFGNGGLSDIISALKFVKHNAKVFNGDSNLITLAGRYSGAMAISTLITSPIFYSDPEMTKPLAKRVIIHGGAASSDYAVDSNPSELFSNFAAEANCVKGGDGKESLLCLQNMDSSELLRIGTKFMANWRPAIDGTTVLGNSITAIEFGQFSSNISFLVGDNTDSGSLCYDKWKHAKSLKVLRNFAADTLTEDQFKSLTASNIQEFYNINDSTLINLIAHEYYFRPSLQSGMETHNSWRDAYLQFCGALYIRNPVELFARYASRQNAIVYRYEFAYQPTTSRYPEYFDGALGDEISLIFPNDQTQFSNVENNVPNSLLEAWTNFIKTGNPSSQSMTWENFNEINKTLISVTRDLKVSTTNNLDADVYFFRQVFLPLHQLLSQCPIRNLENVPFSKVIPINESVPHAQKHRGISAVSVCIGIIGLSLGVTAAIYMTLSRARVHSYKW